MAYTFLLSDETINSYGTRVLTAGIRLGNFLKNPIMLWNHTRAWSDKEDQILPIGRWENLRVENGKLYGDAVFDEKDEFAQKIKNKVEQKIINGCSVCVAVITTSEDTSVLEKGQTRPTIVECELREVSIVDIPSNKNAVRLMDWYDNKEIRFSEGEDNHLLPLLINKIDMAFKEDILNVLQLKEAGDTEVIREITRLRNDNQELVTLRQDKTRLEGELKVFKDKEAADHKAQIEAYVDAAIKDRKITQSDREAYLGLAEKDFDGVKKILDARQGVKEPETNGEGGSNVWEERFSEIKKKNNLE